MARFNRMIHQYIEDIYWPERFSFDTNKKESKLEKPQRKTFLSISLMEPYFFVLPFEKKNMKTQKWFLESPGGAPKHFTLVFFNEKRKHSK